MVFEFETSATRRSVLRAAAASMAALSFGSHAQSARWAAVVKASGARLE